MAPEGVKKSPHGMDMPRIENVGIVGRRFDTTTYLLRHLHIHLHPELSHFIFIYLFTALQHKC